MKPEIFAHCIGELETQFGRKFTDKGKELVFNNIRDCSDEAMLSACDKLYRGAFPILDTIEARVREEQARIFAPQERDDSLRAIEKRRKDWEDSVDKAVSSGYAKNAVRAFRLMFSDADDDRKLECFRVMDRAFPGLGWAQEGAKLERMMMRYGYVPEKLSGKDLAAGER